MDKRLAMLCLSSCLSLPATAGWVSADDFNIGDNVTAIASGVTLNWLDSTSATGKTYSDTYVRDFITPAGHQHFGSTTSSTTYDLFPGFWQETQGSPNFHDYAGLQINFAQATRSFGFKAENNTSSHFALFLFDTSGNYLDYLQPFPNENRAVVNPDTSAGLFRFGLNYEYTFAYDVGSIVIGGASDAGYIYALKFADPASLPEPSIAFLLLGSLGLLGLRRVARSEAFSK